VAAFTDTVYLPAGRWIDYWTGTEHQGPKEMPCAYPQNRAGGLFIKAGAIIPNWPEMDYVGEVPIETIKWQIYPETKSDYTLYEDDGNSLEYLNGKVSKTTVRCESAKERVKVTISPRQGDYQGMPAHRSHEVWIHTVQPKAVTIVGTGTNKTEWSYDQQIKAVCVIVPEDPERKAPVTVECDL
jgi:alpha-glucosidase (family GH31 glycosyl hydrolase)